ncbi:MAG: oligopeptidase B [Microbacterium sp. SCN 70-27]|uniref:S9 family peptidase n=1 Tax=unclassified Microbacterium TaxID=2609290 RepID=UPI0008694E55|nr:MULTISPECIES: S9 family peptidase [unclassified Microbacterium]ODT27094.1 MAG: oligopeptidase B [Microbacterium sp. SCN 70-27]
MTRTRPTAPVAAVQPATRTHHGDAFVDDYEWLRAKDDPAVIAHLEAENAYTEERTAHLAPLRQRIFDEIKARTLETDLSVPTRQGAWWYYGRTVEGKQYGIHCRAPLASPDDWTPPELQPGVDVAGEVVLLDGNIEADGNEFFSLGSFDVSTDGTRLLYGVDTEGDERYTLRVRDLATGADLDDIVENTSAGACFSPDGRHIVYTTVDDAWRPDTVWLHEVGTDASADVQLYHESDERYWVGAGFTRSEAYLVIEVGSSITSEELLVPASDLHAEPRTIWPRREGVEYSATHAVVGGEDVLYVLHNDGALDFELVRVSAEDPTGARAVVLPHQPGRRLLDVSAFRDWAVVSYRREGLARLGILSYGDDTVAELDFPEDLYAAGAGGNPEWAPPVVRLGYGSFVTPGTVYDYDVATGEFLLRKRQPVLGGYSPEDYAQRRDWALAQDGTRVPVSLVWKRSFGEPGEGAARPLHLYGYGSYEHSIEPGFSVARLSMLDRGVVFAIAHVRGGGEMGRRWYEDGKLDRKRNTFTDLVSVAEHLVASGVTSPDLLVAEGGSAGGLLMGAVANLAPELFAGILADVPFVDALTTILDPSLPLTVIEWDEWGDPLHDADVYAYMKSYTPYENVRAGVRYPRILATTSLNDTRVYYVEPAKWVARLREVGADALLKCEMVAGHGGVSGRYNAWHQRAFELAWLLDVLGAAEAGVAELGAAEAGVAAG